MAPKRAISEYSLAERIKYLRGIRGHMSQLALAKASGVSQSTIAQIESGKKDPSISTLEKIASALDVHIAVLFATEDVHVFDMLRLKKKYSNADKLNPTMYAALAKVLAWARGIGF